MPNPFRGLRLNFDLPPATRGIIFVCSGVYLGFLALSLLSPAASFRAGLFYYLALVPSDVVGRLYLWQLLTHMFIHLDFMHLLFNMLALWMLGSAVERMWGSRKFLWFYLYCGIGVGVVLTVVSLAFNQPMVGIGASGAVYGVLLAFGWLFPEAVIYFIIFPMKARVFVLLMAAMLFFQSLQYGSFFQAAGHLSGMAFALVYLELDERRWGLSQWLPTSWRFRMKRGRPRPKAAAPSSSDPLATLRVDTILDKIKGHGMGSLTPEEKKLLDQASDDLRRRKAGVIDLERFRRRPEDR